MVLKISKNNTPDIENIFFLFSIDTVMIFGLNDARKAVFFV
jgi:hypothetical protein